MEPVVVFALGVIILLAVFDLWIGVANDAANFLNSAIGSRVATPRTILMIAAGGVLLGALTSNGLMEVARRGVFDPSRFTDADGTVMLMAVLSIYLGVMASDVLLLDLFNTLGLPTSTTVSIVSELVGASIAVSLWLTPGGVPEALGVIHAGPVLGIYSGIFLSVLVAFTVSAALMFVIRLLYGHDLSASFPRWGWLWTGLAYTSLAYFVVYKGLKSSGLLASAQQAWISRNVALLGALVFALAAGAGFVARRHPRRLLGAIILTGTGALGLAFAGNDLVNFIGPSIAAAQAVLVEDVDLSGVVTTPPWVLLLAGGIMVTALATSAKARRVRDTEVRLAGSGAPDQRFHGNAVARSIVNGSLLLHRIIRVLSPAVLRSAAQRRVTERPPPSPDDPPYDLLRASVNLVVAALIISLGTASQLPLSTTYITFTSAMGAALGDRVWTRADADQRVAGMLAVLSGWLLTGVIAAIGAFVMASIIALGGGWGVLAASVLVAIGLTKLAGVGDPTPHAAASDAAAGLGAP